MSRPQSDSLRALHLRLRGRNHFPRGQRHFLPAQSDSPPDRNHHFPPQNFANRAVLIQSATTLIERAKADNLPGFKTPEKIAPIESLLAKYEKDESDQAETGKQKELARLGRDELVDLINIQRAATQHAADAIWPHTDPNNRPIRKTFAIPLGRSMGL